MKRFLIGFGLGVAGIALALGLTLGALAVAGPDIGAPPTPPTFDTRTEETTPSMTPSPDGGKDDHGKDDDRDSPSPSASVSPDDHSGSSDGSGSGSSDSSDDDDHSDSGSDHEPDDD